MAARHWCSRTATVPTLTFSRSAKATSARSIRDLLAVPELVGLLPDDPNELIDENSPITPGGRLEKSEGFVTACVWSVVH